MKLLHKNNLYCWSQFDADRNIDFHSYLWVRDKGNIFRIRLRYHSADPRIHLREQDQLTGEEFDLMKQKLERLDKLQ